MTSSKVAVHPRWRGKAQHQFYNFKKSFKKTKHDYLHLNSNLCASENTNLQKCVSPVLQLKGWGEARGVGEEFGSGQSLPPWNVSEKWFFKCRCSDYTSRHTMKSNNKSKSETGHFKQEQQKRLKGGTWMKIGFLQQPTVQAEPYMRKKWRINWRILNMLTFRFFFV